MEHQDFETGKVNGCERRTTSLLASSTVDDKGLCSISCLRGSILINLNKFSTFRLLEILDIRELNLSTCRQVIFVNGNWDKFHLEEADVFYGLGQVSIARCTSCLTSLGLVLDGTFHTLEDVLYDKSKKADGWLKVETEWEKRVLFILNQIIHKDFEEPDESLMEVEFAFPPPSDLVKLVWVNKQAVGFYTVKLKGTLDIESMSWYTMTTLDTLFIRKCHRGKGLGYSAIKSLLVDFPDQNIGFSYPISLPMGKVLRKHLELTPSDRPRFWEITGCGTEGNTRNLWLMLNRPPKKLS